jgi:hypothetical protein
MCSWYIIHIFSGAHCLLNGQQNGPHCYTYANTI